MTYIDTISIHGLFNLSHFSLKTNPNNPNKNNYHSIINKSIKFISKNFNKNNDSSKDYKIEITLKLNYNQQIFLRKILIINILQYICFFWSERNNHTEEFIDKLIKYFSDVCLFETVIFKIANRNKQIYKNIIISDDQRIDLCDIGFYNLLHPIYKKDQEENEVYDILSQEKFGKLFDLIHEYFECEIPNKNIKEITNDLFSEKTNAKKTLYKMYQQQIDDINNINVNDNIKRSMEKSFMYLRDRVFSDTWKSEVNANIISYIGNWNINFRLESYLVDLLDNYKIKKASCNIL